MGAHAPKPSKGLCRLVPVRPYTTLPSLTSSGSERISTGKRIPSPEIIQTKHNIIINLLIYSG